MIQKVLSSGNNKFFQIFISVLILISLFSVFYVKNMEAIVNCSDGTQVDNWEDCPDATTDNGSTDDSGSNSSSESKGIDLTLDDVVSIIQNVAGYFYSIAIALAVILTIYVGILFFTAGGDDQQVGKAKKMMIWLVVGIAVLLIGRGIITLVENILTMAG